MDEILFFVSLLGIMGSMQFGLLLQDPYNVCNIMNILTLMENSGMIKVTGIDTKFGLKVYKVG